MNENYIYTNISCLPASACATYLGEGFSGVCTGGSAVIEVFSVRHRISANDLIVILPLQLVSIHSISDDFSMTFFKVDKDMFMDITSGLYKITPDFFFFMQKNFKYRLKTLDVRRFLGFCRVIDFRGSNDDPIFRYRTVLHLLRIFYWDLYVYYKKNNQEKRAVRNSYKEAIAFQFSMLVFENYKTHRQVAFYADKLHISSKYLTMVIQEVNGRTACECIADYIIVEIKFLLWNANLGIRDIVRETGFSNQSSLSRFFHRHTGMSPSEYRRIHHATIITTD